MEIALTPWCSPDLDAMTRAGVPPKNTWLRIYAWGIRYLQGEKEIQRIAAEYHEARKGNGEEPGTLARRFANELEHADVPEPDWHQLLLPLWYAARRVYLPGAVPPHLADFETFAALFGFRDLLTVFVGAWLPLARMSDFAGPAEVQTADPTAAAPAPS